eukprot:gene9727-6815_t
MPLEACSGLWRSEDMLLLSLRMQREVAHDAVLKLGEVGQFQFEDLNANVSAFQRDFVQEVRRCDEMDRRIRFILEEMKKAGIATYSSGAMLGETMFSLEKKIEDVFTEVSELNEQYVGLIERRNHLKEHLEILSREYGGSSGEGVFLLTGVIPNERLHTLEQMVYRVTRGNSLMHTDAIGTPFYSTSNNTAVYKSIFALYFSASRLREKLAKICDVNGATVYPYAENLAQLRGMCASLQQDVDAVTDTLQQTSAHQRQALLSVASVVVEWRRAVVTERAVFATMSNLSFSGATATALGWAPARSYDDICAAIREAEENSGAQVATIIEEQRTREVPPTYFKTNKVTASFQGIVDSYGMARYKEVNPGVLTIITFPYLFGVMYGDIGHGLILTIFAAFLIFKEKSFQGQSLNEIFAMIFGGRYLLLFMGFFAVYMGMLYNDMFGFSVELFRTGYQWPALPPEGPEGTVTPTAPNGKPNVKPSTSVPFGIDSAWAETENKLEFYNSIKMKCSVIIGVAQMLAGVVLSLLNYQYFKEPMKIKFRFIPEIVFLCCTFGYMCLLIVIKWLTTWENTHDAPSLLETMTNFFLAPGTVTLPLYPGQATIQVLLLLISTACVPVMLVAIPYLEKKEHDKKVRERLLQPQELDEFGMPVEEEDDFEFSEIVIHQVIHTIEYVLGCVSNTASYLRLWALSLAHSQLSEVFWSFAFLLTVDLDGGSGVFVFIGFAIWMAATLGVLLGMESLSAFLHALRLHWVEFNNKFYAADGHPFEPFDLAELLKKSEDYPYLETSEIRLQNLFRRSWSSYRFAPTGRILRKSLLCQLCIYARSGTQKRLLALSQSPLRTEIVQRVQQTGSTIWVTKKGGPMLSSVPVSWLHPDLRRLLLEQESREQHRRLADIARQEEALKTKCVNLTVTKVDLEMKRLQMIEAIKHMEESLNTLDERMRQSEAFVKDLEEQHTFHKTCIQQQLETPIAATEMLASSIGLPTPTNCSKAVLEVHFWHLFNRPSLCGPSWECAARSAARSESEDTAVPDAVRTIEHFLRIWFPLLRWKNGQPGELVGPSFYQAPCQMERAAAAAACSGSACHSPLCLYWHIDQLHHLKEMTHKKMHSMLMNFCTRDVRVCVASHFIWTSMERLQSSQTVEEFCARLIFTASEIICRGWYTMAGPFTTQSKSKTTKRQKLVSGWSAPFARVHSSNTAGTSFREDLLRDESEIAVWGAIREEASSGTAASTAAAHLFGATQNALTWRCLLRAVGKNVEQRQWLARQGWLLCASSPHLALSYVLSLSEGHSWDIKKAVDVCLEVSAILTSQCVGSLYGADRDAARFTAVTTRYIAYMIAATAVRVAGRESKEWVESRRLVQTAAEPGRFFLVPVALHNITLLCAAVHQATEYGLQGVDLLPLGAISDQIFLLSDAGSHSPGGAVPLLNQHLKLLNRCEEATLQCSLMDELRTSAQLSLMRCFHLRLAVAEQLVLKSFMNGEVSQSVLWLEQLSMMERDDTIDHGTEMTGALLDACAESRNYLALLLLVWRLEGRGVVPLLPADVVLDDSSDSTLGDTECCLNAAARIIVQSYPLVLEERVKLLRDGLVDPRFCHDPNAITLILMALLRIHAVQENVEAFTVSLRMAGTVLLEQHLAWWSPLDVFYDEIIGVPHFTLLLVFRLVPALLMQRSLEGATLEWRQRVLDVGASLGVLHPLLRSVV